MLYYLFKICGMLAKLISSAIRYSDGTESRKAIKGLLFLIINVRKIRLFYIVETSSREPKLTSVVVPVSHNEDLPVQRPTEIGLCMVTQHVVMKLNNGLLTEKQYC
jgi:hypothetical protein